MLESRDRLIRRLKLNSYFKGHEENYGIEKRFVEKSNFIPKNEKLDPVTIQITEKLYEETNKIIKKYKSNIIKKNSTSINGHSNSTLYPNNSNNTSHSTSHISDLEKYKGELLKLHEKNNLSSEECKALRELRSNKNIIIKPADKGGATVIMNKESYIKEAYRQLKNSKYYKKLEQPIYHDNVKCIQNVLGEMLDQKFITKKQFNYLSGPKDYCARTFYLLPKIHKNKSQWPSKDMPQGRPIVSDVNSETYRISSFIDYYVNPLTTTHASYVKNSFDFVKKVQGYKIEKNWLLVTGDVSSLYTNMHFDRTIECVKEAFRKNPDSKRPDSGLLKLLEISLKNNDFNFNGEYFLQILGTAMGKRFAPGLANLYLLEFDEKARNGFPIKPILFIRYLDDIFFLWPGSVESLKEYETYLNSLIPDIKITLEYSEKEIPFLDVFIYENNNELNTKTYFKETDTHQLLHTSSFHPRHTFKGLIKSQLIRFKRLSSKKSDYNCTCKILFNYLKHRGYSLGLLRKLQHNVWHDYIDKTANGDNQTKNEEIIPIIVDYCKIGTELSKKYKSILKENTTASNNTKFITAYRGSKNLKGLLVRSKLDDGRIGAFHGCSAPRCQTCKIHAPPSSDYIVTTTGQRVKVGNDTYCHTKNIIYLVTCMKCKKQYIGESSRSLRDRLNDHKSDIRNKKATPLATHFNMPNHSVLDLRIIPISIVENHIERLEREKHFQNVYKTAYPMGINNTPVL